MTFESITVEPPEPATSALIWLHGLGASADDFIDLARQLHREMRLPLRCIFPQAKLKPVTLNGGYVMPAWYDIYALTFDSPEDEAGLKAVSQDIHQLIQHQISSGISSQHIFLGGFSQGGATALYTALRYPEKLAGVIGFSTYLPLMKNMAQEASLANKNTPILMTHGIQDAVVLPSWGEASREVLRGLGYAVDWKTYPMAHQVCFEELQDLQIWLEKS